ncbi:MAG: hypothetical protein ACJA0B_001642 [Alcanivorax borkumensis]
MPANGAASSFPLWFGNDGRTHRNQKKAPFTLLLGRQKALFIVANNYPQFITGERSSVAAFSLKTG